MPSPGVAPRHGDAAAETGLVTISKAEQRVLDDKAQLFSLITTADRLEQLYVKGVVSADVYEKQCWDLITKFKVARLSFDNVVPDIAAFSREFRCDAQHGYHHGYRRLVISGMPATREHAPSAVSEQLQVVFECSAWLISLNEILTGAADSPLMRTAESLLQPTEDLHLNFGRIAGLESSPHRDLFQKWTIKLNAMRAHEYISEAECEEFKLGVNKAYDDLDRVIKRSRR
jgi:VPS28 protein